MNEWMNKKKSSFFKEECQLINLEEMVIRKKSPFGSH